jgi:hypothetical protein
MPIADHTTKIQIVNHKDSDLRSSKRKHIHRSSDLTEDGIDGVHGDLVHDVVLIPWSLANWQWSIDLDTIVLHTERDESRLREWERRVCGTVGVRESEKNMRWVEVFFFFFFCSSSLGWTSKTMFVSVLNTKTTLLYIYIYIKTVNSYNC